MKKILVLSGSPKPEESSDSALLTERFLRGYGSAEPVNVETVRLADCRIAPCRGCFACWESESGYCAFGEDDLNGLLDKYRAADLVIFSFPLYVFSAPAPVKLFLDRSIAMLRWNLRQDDDGVIRHLPVDEDLYRKPPLVICSGGMPDWGDNFTPLRDTFRFYFGSPTVLCVPQAPLLQAYRDPNFTPARERLALLEAAGEEFARTRTLSDGTLAALGAPILPNDAYIDFMNHKRKG